MENTTPAQPDPWPPGRVAVATLTVLALVGAFYILIQFRAVFFSLFSAIVISTAFTPLVNRLEKWKIPRSASTIFISLVVLALLVAFILTVAPLMIEQSATLTNLVGSTYQELHQDLLQSPSLLVRRIARQLPTRLPLTLSPPESIPAEGENSFQAIEQALAFSGIILSNLLTIGAVALLTGFWILEGERTGRIILLAIPSNRRDTIREFLGEVNNKVGAYTRGLIWLSLIVGGLSMAAYLIIGLPNVLLLGVIAGVMEAVPLIGPLLGAIPAFFVAASTSPEKIIWVVVATVIIQTLENNLIVPRVMDKAVGVNPVVGLLAFLAFGTLFGFVGALLAIPLAAVIQLALTRFVFNPRPAEEAQSMGRDAISMLRYDAQNLVQDVRKQIREKEEEPDAGVDLVEDTMESIVQDLDSILAQVEQNTNGERT